MTYEQLEKDIKAYLREYKRELVLPRKAVRKQVYDLSVDIETFVELRPDVVYADIIAHFGTPVARAQLIMGREPEGSVRKTRRNRLIFRIVTAVILAVLAVTSTVIVIIAIQASHSRSSTTYSYILDPGEEQIYIPPETEAPR